MTISKRGEFDLTLGGETFNLVFKYETLLPIEESFDGKSIDEIYLKGNVSRSAIAEAIRCGLMVNHGKKRTRIEVARMIQKSMETDQDAHDTISSKVILAVLAANGVSEEDLMRIAKENDSDKPQGKERATKDRPTLAPVSTSTG